MTISLSKNVPSLMAMTLGMVSMIAPIDAKKSKGKKAKGAPPAVAQTTPAVAQTTPAVAQTTPAVAQTTPAVAQTQKSSASAQCFWVIRSWQLMEKTTLVNPNSSTACCYYLVSSTGTITDQTSGIPGVKCTSTGIVTEINWFDQNLMNSIPAELGNLTNLKVLNVGYNWLKGAIPAELGNLRNLELLDFYYNYLTGPIPAELGNLRKLHHLGFATNQLTGSIPSSLDNLRNLTYFGLGGNKLTGSIPSWLENLRNLTALELSHNNLTGQIPSSLGNLRNLQALSLADNKLTGPIPAELGNLTNLQTLNLDHNTDLNGTFTPYCKTVVSVQDAKVTINSCLLSFTICNTQSPQCCWVKRSWELMEKTTSVSSTNATACCYYLVSSTGTIRDQTSGIPGVKCTSTGIVTEINWFQQNLMNSIPAELGNLTNLKVLYVLDNWLKGAIPAELGNLRNLELLNFYYNYLTGPIPAELGNLTNLQSLDLSSNQLNGSIPKELGKFTKLQALNLWGNKLTGSIPLWLGNLRNLTGLGLSHNNLTGQIPSSLGNLTNLQALHLEDNQLIGPIPAELGNLTNLQRLWLYDNIGLNGTFTPQCSTHLWLTGTDITICGGAAAMSPPGSYPHPGTPDSCLANGCQNTLAKRAQIYSVTLEYRTYTCHTDNDIDKNPYADCLNSMAEVCNPAIWNSDSTKKDTCREAVDQMFAKLSTHWQKVREECGRWKNTQNGTSYAGVYPSTKCASANADLIANAFYTRLDGAKVPVTSGLTNSINVGLWSQVTA